MHVTRSRDSHEAQDVRAVFLDKCCRHDDGSSDELDDDKLTLSRSSVREYSRFAESRAFSRGDYMQASESRVETEREAQIIQADLEKIKEKLSDRERHLEFIVARYERRRSEIEKEIEKLHQEAKSFEDSLRNMSDPIEPDDQLEEVPPGPPYLMWIEGPSFSLFSSLVVLMNIVFMAAESIFAKSTVYHKLKPEVILIDQVFLVFYIVEISIKAVLWRSKLLVGRPCSIVWANWLDLVIIVTAVVDQWILHPLFHGGSGVSLSFLRFFRLARLFRIFKVCGLWLRADLSWTEGDNFTNFILGVIVVNCLLMGVQVSFPHHHVWDYTENLVLAIFLFELAVRLRYNGFRFFYNDNWVMNWLDFIIVVGGMIDLWLIPSISYISQLLGGKHLDAGDFGQVMTMLRMLRLVRLLRLIRLVRSITPLYNLLLGIIQAMQGMFWVLALTVAILYLLALLCCQLIGPNGYLIKESDDETRDVIGVFYNVPMGMWALFMAMNGDCEYLQPVLDAYPISIFFTSIYMIFTGFAILSVLTGVVCDKMSCAAEEEAKQKEEIEARTKIEENNERMEHLFSKLDVDGSGLLSISEFRQVLENDELAEELCEAAEMERPELHKIWDTLSKSLKQISTWDVAASISKKDWMEGILSARHTATELSVRRIEKELAEIKRAVITPR